MVRLPGFLFKRRYEKLLPVFERAHLSELRSLLFQPRGVRINFLPLTINALQRLQAPQGEKRRLQITRVYSTWNFDLVIFYEPWSTEKNPYSPLIFYRRRRKVAGILLPLNELHGYLTKRATDQIFELSKEWIRIAMTFHGEKK